MQGGEGEVSARECSKAKEVGEGCRGMEGKSRCKGEHIVWGMRHHYRIYRMLVGKVSIPQSGDRLPCGSPSLSVP